MPTVDTQAWAKRVRGLEAMRDLRYGWDGMDALPPAPGVVDAAVSLAHRLIAMGCTCPDFASLEDGGTIHFEWESEAVDIEVVGTGRAEVLFGETEVDRADG